MTAREIIEQHFRASGAYVMRSELERLAVEAEFTVAVMRPLLELYVGATSSRMPADLRREIWTRIVEDALDDLERKEEEAAEVEDVLQQIENATMTQEDL